MTEYEKGFFDALETVIEMGDLLRKFHFDNAQNESLSDEDQESAFNCSIVMGKFCSNIINLAASMRKKEIKSPIKIKKRHWWSE